MSGEILLLAGPNLELLGERSPEIYRTTTWAEHVARIPSRADAAGYTVRDLQTSFEGDLIEAVHDARENCVAVVVNAGALSHTSWALADALATFEGVKLEVHLSNPAAREPYRHVSTLAGVVNGTIAGFSALSYDLALEAVVRLLES